MNGICAIKGCIPGRIILDGRLVIAVCQRCKGLITSLVDNETNKQVWVPGNYAVLPAQFLWILSGSVAEDEKCRNELAQGGLDPERIRVISNKNTLSQIANGRILLCGSWYMREEVISDPLFAKLINKQSL